MTSTRDHTARARLLSSAIVAAAGLSIPLYADSTPRAQSSGADLVRLRYAAFDPTIGIPAVPELLRAAPAAEVFLVQFASTPTEAMRQQIAELGGTVHRFLTDNTHVVRMAPDLQEQIAALPCVRWVGPYHPAYRLDESIRAELLAGATSRTPTRYSIELFERSGAAKARLADHIRSLGGAVELITSGFRMEASLTRDQLLEIVRLDDVNFIDIPGPIAGDMDIVRQLVGAVPLLSSAGFTGQGVRGAVVDLGFDPAHPAFQNPPPLIQCAGSGADPFHGTAVYGILFGNGAGQPAATGLLPDAQQGIFCLASAAANPYQQVGELLDPAGPYRAAFRSQSFGSARARYYTTISAQVDDIFFLFDLLNCQSMGNFAASLDARPEAWAKNVVSVGGIAHQNTLSRADDSGSLTSIAADGRIKPDLAGVLDGVFTTAPGGQFSEFSGTSAATPQIAGAAGLVLQMWHEGVWTGFGGGASVFADRPAHSTARALLINSAFQYDWTAGGPNASITRSAQGWGMPDLQALYDARANTFIINETDLLLPGQLRSYTLFVPPGEPALKATMVYLDPPGNPAAAQARINDLNLRITAPDQTVYWGNHGLATGLWSTPGGSPDPLNVVENIFIQNPQRGTWTVDIIGEQIVQDAYLQTPQLDATFALVVMGVGCYANCDASTTAPILNVDDFTCFINQFAAAQALPHQQQVEHYANCDGSTAAPVLNVDDFTCFINAFAAGCR